MAYRNITVDGKEYRYSLGRTHLKIRGRQAVLKTEVGVVVSETTTIVTPKMIQHFIQGKPLPVATDYFPSCGHKGAEFRCDPFDLEIYDKKIYGIWCDDCYAARAADI